MTNGSEDDHHQTSEDEQYLHYISHWQLLYDIERESARTLDKTLVTLSGGALGLSITFIKEIAKHPRGTGFLYAAWIFFILSLLSTLISFAATQRAARNEREQMTHDIEQYMKGEQSKENVDREHTKTKNIFRKLTIYLNTMSIALFIIGASLLTIFSGKNLSL
ncbi:MAG: hypothetical protein ACYC57_08190 [Thermoleophilia bacterium]